MKTNKLYVFIFVMLFFFGCCQQHTNNTAIAKEYYYVRYHEIYDTIPYIYEAHQIFDKNEMRRDIVYSYPSKKQETYFYKVRENGLDRCLYETDSIILPFILIKTDTCIIWESLFTFKQCYLGQENITLNNSDTVYAYKFLVSLLPANIDVPDCYSYYDNNFILLKEEDCNSGFVFKKRIDSIPNKFKHFLDSIGF